MSYAGNALLGKATGKKKGERKKKYTEIIVDINQVSSIGSLLLDRRGKVGLGTGHPK